MILRASGSEPGLVRGKYLGTYEVGLQYPSSFSFPRMLGQLVTSLNSSAQKWASLETMTSLEALDGVADLMR